MRFDVAPVSVVIPCYRCAATVGRAVASVRAQTQPVAEIILVDDASGDDTLAALHRLQADWAAQLGLPSVIVLAAGRNGGAGEARNLGWEQASQPWLAFLDADDAWHPRKIEIQYASMGARPDAVLSAHQTRVARSTESDWPIGEAAMALVRRISAQWLPFSNVIPTRSVILRRDLPWRFYSGKRYSEDFALWLKIVASGGVAYKLELPLACSFRPEYSAGGLSAQLWRQELGELDALHRIRQEGLMSAITWCAASGWSLLKYVRRRVIQWIRECAIRKARVNHGD
jgi:glycosyltransferase involved in cell wall biosynthesis